MCDLDERDKRIEQILGRFDMNVNEEASLRYMDYLKRNIEFPCQLTGIEDFPWEEYYVLGPGSNKEYEKLKKKQPSYTDTFNLISFKNDLDENNGILVKVGQNQDHPMTEEHYIEWIQVIADGISYRKFLNQVINLMQNLR